MIAGAAHELVDAVFARAAGGAVIAALRADAFDAVFDRTTRAPAGAAMAPMTTQVDAAVRGAAARDLVAEALRYDVGAGRAFAA